MCPHDRKLSGQALRKTLEQPHREHPGRTVRRMLVFITISPYDKIVSVVLSKKKRISDNIYFPKFS